MIFSFLSLWYKWVLVFIHLKNLDLDRFSNKVLIVLSALECYQWFTSSGNPYVFMRASLDCRLRHWCTDIFETGFNLARCNEEVFLFIKETILWSSALLFWFFRTLGEILPSSSVLLLLFLKNELNCSFSDQAVLAFFTCTDTSLGHVLRVIPGLETA